MSDSADRYAEARTALRDTARWYTTTLAALGAALAGGLSFGILPVLKDSHLVKGLAVGGIVVVCILIAIILMQNILFPRAFGAEEIKGTKVAKLLGPHLKQLLPKDIPDIAALDAKIAISTGDELAELRQVQFKITSFAAFLDLERKIRATNGWILALFVVACLGIGYLAYLKGIAEAAKDEGKQVAVRFDAGPGWNKLAQELAVSCPGPGPFPATAVGDTPFTGWWTITLTAPGPCDGIVLSVPNAAISAGP